MAQQKDTKTGKWMYYGSYVDGTGKRVQYKKRGFDTKREARKAEDDFRDTVTNPESYMTFSELCIQYNEYAKKRVKKATIRDNIYTFSKIEKEIGGIKIADLDRKIMQSYIDQLDNDHSKNYVEKIYYAINKVMRYAVDVGLLRANPMNGVKPSARKDEEPTEMSIWEPGEFAKFILTVDDPMYKCIFMTLFNMGLRRGELLGLQWRYIDLDKKTLRVQYTWSKQGELTKPKTASSYRTITMPNILVEEMKRWRKIAETFSGCNATSFVFGNDRPIGFTTLTRRFEQYVHTANEKLSDKDKLELIRIHDFRHSHASFLINNMPHGFSDYDIAKRLGDTVETLHRTYAHWFREKDKWIIDFMNKSNEINKEMG